MGFIDLQDCGNCLNRGLARITQMTRIIGRVMPVGVGDNCLKQDLQDFCDLQDGRAMNRTTTNSRETLLTPIVRGKGLQEVMRESSLTVSEFGCGRKSFNSLGRKSFNSLQTGRHG